MFKIIFSKKTHIGTLIKLIIINLLFLNQINCANAFNLSEALPVYFSVNKLEILDNYKMPLSKPNIEHKMRRSPSIALTSWAHNVIRTQGNEGFVKLIINQASATIDNIDAKTTVFNFFKNKQSYRITVYFSGRLEIIDQRSQKNAYVNIESKFSKTAPEAASLSELENLYDYVTNEALGKFDKEFRIRLLDLSEFLI